MLVKYSDQLFSDNSHVIIATLFFTVSFYYTLYWTLYSWVTHHAYTKWNKDTNSTMRYFIELNQAKQYMYVEYITSLINATVCSLIVPPILLLCTPPPEK